MTLGWPLLLSGSQSPYLHSSETGTAKVPVISAQSEREGRAGSWLPRRVTTSPQYPGFSKSPPLPPDKSDLVPCGDLAPRPTKSSPRPGWVYSLTKPDRGGSSALLTQRVGVLVSVQVFPFPPFWRPTSVGELRFPIPLHSPALSLSQVTVRKTTLIST